MVSRGLLKFINEYAPGMEPGDEKLHILLIEDIKKLKERLAKAKSEVVQ